MGHSGKESTTFKLHLQPKPFGLLTKPAGSNCNLHCDYCYYLEKRYLYGNKKSFRMKEDVLEEFVLQYIQAQPVPVVQFVWQGGEPCLMGLDFYQKVVALQRKHAGGKMIENSIQTNGVLLNDDWCRFLKENNFLVGISVDGPERIHNKYRQTRNNGPTFDNVMRAVNLLKTYQIDFNTLTVVNNYNVDYPLEIYRFLKAIGSHYMQFLPVVERCKRDCTDDIHLLSNAETDGAVVTEWSVNALKYGKFLTTMFDEWVKNDVGRYFVQMFDATLANWAGLPPGVCVMSEKCGDAGIIEHNGDIYSCDHFVFPEHRLGNIMEDNLAGLMNSVQQQIFGENKHSTLPRQCRECTYLTKCWGECPKNRILISGDGEYGLNYLCEGLKYYFFHVAPAMDFMANEIFNKRSPANIMFAKL